MRSQEKKLKPTAPTMGTIVKTAKIARLGPAKSAAHPHCGFSRRGAETSRFAEDVWSLNCIDRLRRPLPQAKLYTAWQRSCLASVANDRRQTGWENLLWPQPFFLI